MYPRYLFIRSKLLQLYLMGLKGIFETKRTWSYGFFRRLLVIIASIFFVKYLKIQIRPESEKMEQPGWYPKWVYKSREEHYKFWELSRIMRNKPAIFSFYDYDETSDFLFYTDEHGIQTSQKNSLHLERKENSDNPLFEEIIREFKATGSKNSIKKGNLLVAYQKNKDNYLSLHNYLYYKPITPEDIARGLFYNFMIKLKLTNYYRYDHFVSKSDFLYEVEKLKLAMNLFDKNKENRIAEYSHIFDLIYQNWISK